MIPISYLKVAVNDREAIEKSVGSKIVVLMRFDTRRNIHGRYSEKFLVLKINEPTDKI